MHFDMVETGIRIKGLRKSKKLTQEQLAEALNISRIHLAHIEIGEKAPSIDLMVAMLVFFDSSLDYIVLGKEDK